MEDKEVEWKPKLGTKAAKGGRGSRGAHKDADMTSVDATATTTAPTPDAPVQMDPALAMPMASPPSAPAPAAPAPATPVVPAPFTGMMDDEQLEAAAAKPPQPPPAGASRLRAAVSGKTATTATPKARSRPHPPARTSPVPAPVERREQCQPDKRMRDEDVEETADEERPMTYAEMYAPILPGAGGRVRTKGDSGEVVMVPGIVLGLS